MNMTAELLLGAFFDSNGQLLPESRRRPLAIELRCNRPQGHLLAIVVNTVEGPWLAARTGYSKNGGWRADWLNDDYGIGDCDVICDCNTYSFDPRSLVEGHAGAIRVRDLARDPNLPRSRSLFAARRADEFGDVHRLP